MVLLLPLPGVAGEVVVKLGETLAEIANRYGTTVERLMEMNGLHDANDLWAGSRIRVPGASSQSQVSSNASSHTLQTGETLSEIAARYGVPISRLVALNNLGGPDQLIPGLGRLWKTPSVPRDNGDVIAGQD